MRRRFTYVLMWVVATAVTAGGSWLGVRSVLNAGGAQGPSPLSAADVRDAVPTTEPPTPTPSPTPSPRPSPTPKPPPKPTPTRPAAPTPTPTPGWRKVSESAGVPTFERIFRVPGGETHITCSPDRVEVLSKTPKPGFTATVQQYGGASLRVSFTSDRHTSRVFVSWRDECYSEVSESV